MVPLKLGWLHFTSFVVNWLQQQVMWYLSAASTLQQQGIQQQGMWYLSAAGTLQQQVPYSSRAYSSRSCGTHQHQ
eukprot:scaffold87812_cov21-Tisochrysis_lutea.AAC.1